MAVITVTSTADSGAGSLRAVIAAARSGDIIQFGAGLANKTILLTSGQIEIAPGKNITIDGAGAANLTISGNNASRIFLVNSNQDSVTNVAIKNLTLTNGRTTEEGGAILGEHKANITVENVKFKANTADKGGGAIYSKWENNLTVINSQFDGNVATKGNAELGAGAIAFISPGQFLVRNSTFTNNQGINGGAINSLNGKLTIEGSKFLNNSTLAASLDTGKPNPDLRGYGGALYTDRASSVNEPAGTIRIANSQFEGNKSKHGGGGAYLYTGTQDNVVIEGTSFKDNQTDKGVKGDGANGGGLYVISNGQNKGLVLNRTSFVNNTASSQGGGLWMYGAPTTITNSTFSGNKAIFSTVPGQNDFNRNGGAIAFYEAPATITNTTIANNLAGWVAGGILADQKLAVTVKNTIFFNNEAFNGGNPWNIQQHTNRLMSDGGGNIQNTPANDGELAVANIRVADPKLGALQDNGGGLLTHALLAGSPAINAGVTSGAPTIDGRGLNRDSQPDSGAFEFGASGGSNSPGNPNPGTPGNITGTPGNDTLTGTTGKDTILAGAGNDFLTGGLGADMLTTGAGADRVLYRGNNQLTAFAGSRVNSLDRITDFNVVQGDRIQLDYDNNLATSQRPKGLFNAGVVQGNNLTAAVKAAYADKNQKVANAQFLKANEAVLLQWQNRTYLSVNDTVRAFDPTRDFVVNATGLTIPTAHTSAGSLPVNSYFA
ncbi:MAG: calcium-binding protein [Cyanobacteria bacterium RM1_2_2]|nr:calcium-binding protein [Cyanobacteria bacterium RM1_2_2]